jgi:hypothetical protein
MMTQYLGKRFPKKWAAEERFCCSYEKDEQTGCWNWLGRKYGHGYGRFKANGITYMAHRYAWMMSNHSSIPRGFCICHGCDNPACVNPQHLFLGTVADNNADKQRKGRQAKGEQLAHPRARGERNGNSRLTQEQVERIKSDGRSQRKIAADYGVTQSAIWMIKNGKAWK